jgi:Methyltransferase domain
MSRKSSKNLKVIPAPLPVDVTPSPALLKLDFGCGPNKREGFLGVDAIAFPNVDVVLDVTQTPWPWSDNSVEEAHASHFVEHLTGAQRQTFCNELFRVLIPGGKCTIITPHWASCRAYGDPTHMWPPVSEFWFYYLNKTWRAANAPHTDADHVPGGFNCDFDATWGYSIREDLNNMNQERQQFALQNYKEVCQDTIATLLAKKAIITTST